MQIICPNCGKERTNLKSGLYKCDRCGIKFRLFEDMSTIILDLTFLQKIKIHLDSILFILTSIIFWILPYLSNILDKERLNFDIIFKKCILSMIIIFIGIPIGLFFRREFRWEKVTTIELLFRGVRGKYNGLTISKIHYAKTMRFIFFVSFILTLISLVMSLLN